MKKFKGMAIFFGSFLLYHIVASSFFPVDENNVLQAPDGYMTIGILFSVLVTAGATRKKGSTQSPSASKRFRPQNRSEVSFTAPRSKKRQTELASDLISDIKLNISLANKTETVSSFVNWYDEALDDISKLMQLNKVSFNGSPSLDYYNLKDEFQLHLCNAIDRAKEKAVADINGAYRNSSEFQKRAASHFENDVENVRHRFSESTADFADQCIREVRTAAKIQPVSSPHPGGQVAFDLVAVDMMDGHTFESWCANLLKKNGFTNVEVTPGSGDQGVDVLATKEDVKFAIQCKRYNSDLGNTPVQEVIAGRKFYHCQVGVVMTNRYFTAGAKALAETTGTLLWDRDKLQEFMQAVDRP